jgi:hypothetical protein
MAIIIMFHPAALDVCSLRLLINHKWAILSTASVKIKPQILRDSAGVIQTFITITAVAVEAALAIMSVTFLSWL